MSLATVVTRGFGSFGTINALPTLGYGDFAPTVHTTIDGGSIRHGRKRHPEDIEREQRMVQEYLDGLERVKRLQAQHAPARTIKRVEVELPRLTEVVARAATDDQIQRVLRDAADARDRAIAEGERRRRYWAAFIVLASQ